MKKTLFTLIFASAFAVACASHSNHAAAPTPAPVASVVVTPAPVADAGTPQAEQAAPATEEEEPVLQSDFKGDTWSFSTPEAAWYSRQSDNGVMLLNPVLHNRVLFLVNETKRNTHAERDFALKQLASANSGFAVVPGSKKDVKNNGVNFASGSLKANEVQAYVWIAVVDKKAYAFICGGLEDEDKTQQKTCTTIFKTLKITKANGQ